METQPNNNPELNKFFEEFIKPNLPKTKKEWVWFILIILIVITLGLVAVNQYLGIQYKATLIQSPCNLCDRFLIENRRGYASINLSEIYFNSNP